MRKILLIIGILWLTVAVGAQSATCPEIVLRAINQVDSLCQDIARNQICYGHPSVTASPAANVANLNFTNPGSIEQLNRIAAINLSQLDENVGAWGIGVLKVQANLPDTTPGVNVTILSFGNVQMTPDTPTGNMQAFSLSTGIGQIGCNELPDSGVVIQTPEGVGTVQFTINGVNLSVGSTLYIKATDKMWIAVLEGEATITKLGVVQTVGAGQFTSLQMAPNNEVISAPSIPQRYSADDIRGLPLQLLPDEIVVVPGTGSPPAFTGVTCPYTVRSGENLFRIALHSGSTVDEIAALNNITDPTRIYAGQRLLLPACIKGPITTSASSAKPTATPRSGVVNNCYPEIVNYCDPGRPWGDGRCISTNQAETDYNYKQGWYAAALECGVIDSIPEPPQTGMSCSVDADGRRTVDFALSWGSAFSAQRQVNFNFDLKSVSGTSSYSKHVSINSGQTSLNYRFITSYKEYDGGKAYILDGSGKNLTGPISCDE